MIKKLKQVILLWLHRKLSAYGYVEQEIHDEQIRHLSNKITTQGRMLTKCISDLDTAVKSNYDRIIHVQNRQKHTYKKIDSMEALLDDTTKAMSDVYQTVESVVSIGADIQPDMNHDKSWAVVCVEGKMNIVKFLPLNYKDANSMLKYLRGFPTSKSVYDTPPHFKDFGWWKGE